MTGIGKLKEYAPRIVFIPFVDMVSGPVDTVLNVILFVPLGLFLPLLWKKLCRIRNAALTGFLFSLFIEILQMFGRGTTDVNDLITNTIGACLGYLIYTLLSKRIPKAVCRKFQSCETNDGLEVMFYIIYATAIMVTIQPFVIHSLFRLG